MPGVVGGEPVEVDVVGERERAGVDARGSSRGPRGPAAGTATRRSKRPGAQERGVEDLRPVGGAEDDHRDVGLEAVHLGEDLVERLLALVVAAAEAGAGAARAADRIELVDEDDRRRGLLGLLEQVADAAGADADDGLDELGGARCEKNGASASPATARASSVLPVPGRPESSTPLRDPPAELLVALGAVQEVDDLASARPWPRRCRRRPRR